MTLPLSGPISLGDVRTELGNSGAQGLQQGSIDLDRSGMPYSMSELYGASAFTFSIFPSSTYPLSIGMSSQLITINNSGYYWTSQKNNLGDGTVWFRISNTEGSMTTTYLSVEANFLSDSREGSITFTCNGQQKTLIIQQEPGSMCIHYTTMITMADSSKKQLGDCRLGELIQSYKIPHLKDDESNVETWTANSLNGIKKEPAKIVRLEKGVFTFHYIVNGRLKITYEHRVLIKRDIWKFIQMKDVQIGDYFYNEYGYNEKVESLEIVHGEEEFISMDVETTDVYIAEGLLIHNPIDPK